MHADLLAQKPLHLTFVLGKPQLSCCTSPLLSDSITSSWLPNVALSS